MITARNIQLTLFSVLLLICSIGRTAGLEASIRDLGSDLVVQLNNGNVEKVAVVGFTDLNGYRSALGEFISEELTTALISAGGIDVVERRELNRVLSEQSSYSEGIFDRATTIELQKLLGIDSLITGSITNLGDRVKLNARAINVETAKAFAAASATIERDETIDQLMDQSGTPAGSQARTSSRGFGIQSSDTYFKNSYLHLVLTGSAMTEDNKGVQFATEFRNVSGQPLYLATQSSRAAGVISDGGDIFQSGRVVGLEQNGYRTPRTEEEEYTKIESGSHATVLIGFRKRGSGEKIRGSEFALSIELYRLTDNRVEKITVGLPGIELR